MKRLTTEEFIVKAKLIHGDKYSYDKTVYTTAKIKVTITCPIHGDFELTPDKHLQGRGCLKCANEYKSNLFKSNTEEFIKKAKLIHGDKFDYSKVNYNKSSEKIEIICPEHGSFWQTPNDHLSGYGCLKCSHQKLHNDRIKSIENFVKNAQKVHGNKYDYSKVQYYNAHTKICIICPEHGEFLLTPHSHLNGKSGCPICRSSKGEKEIREFLEFHHISYISQYEISIDKSIRQSGIAKIDFYLPKLNIAIEYNGILHYKYIPYFHSGGRIDFEKLKLRDEFVRNYCTDNNIKLIEIKYTDNISNVLTSYYNKINER